MREVSSSDLLRWRSLDSALVLQAIAEHSKRDRTYEPTKDNQSSRWHASVNGADFELLLTGVKFWDCRALKGGGGAIDMVMHLAGVNFRAASQLLTAKGL